MKKQISSTLKLTGIFTILLLSSVALWSCADEEKKASPNLEFIRLDKQITAAQSPQELEELFTDLGFYTKSLYRTFPTDTALTNYLYSVVSHPDTKAFYKETVTAYGDFSDLKSQFEVAFGNIKSKYPQFKTPKIYTTFTGLENDLFVSDSLVIISLEAFLGPDATYRPVQPDYILQRYTQDHIVPQVIRLLAGSYIEHGQGTSLMNDMMFFGKSFEFTKEMLPSVDNATIIGLPDSTMKATWYAQDIIWAHFIENELLYEQSPRVKQKYIGERPFVSEIGPACPGRIGQWLGWRIIQKFRTENPNVTFEELMRLKDTAEILRLSKYRGEVEES